MAKVWVYRYKGWDAINDEYVSPDAYGTDEYINNSNLTRIEGSGIEIDENLLDGNGHVKIADIKK
ncbi:hypothetical protein [Pantoea sp.]|uniref:hypothetical protein n=1 Tax=Pantoea sp. TaxID=69393 RepID=UPI0028ABD0E6|nr:hypothetical protein [Pantoea sp.]